MNLEYASSDFRDPQNRLRARERILSVLPRRCALNKGRNYKEPEFVSCPRCFESNDHPPLNHSAELRLVSSFWSNKFMSALVGAFVVLRKLKSFSSVGCRKRFHANRSDFVFQVNCCRMHFSTKFAIHSFSSLKLLFNSSG